MVVLDTSAAVSAVVDSQSTAQSRAFFSSLSVFVVPAIFPFELRNALLKLRRRGFLSWEGLEDGLRHLDMLIEPRPWGALSGRMNRLLAIGERERLSLFDAAYLFLAESEKLALASRDHALLEAAQRRGVPVHDLR